MSETPAEDPAVEQADNGDTETETIDDGSAGETLADPTETETEDQVG